MSYDNEAFDERVANVTEQMQANITYSILETLLELFGAPVTFSMIGEFLGHTHATVPEENLVGNMQMIVARALKARKDGEEAFKRHTEETHAHQMSATKN